MAATSAQRPKPPTPTLLTAEFKPLNGPDSGWVRITYKPLTWQYGQYHDCIIYADGIPVGMAALSDDDTGAVLLDLCNGPDGKVVSSSNPAIVITGHETYTITAVAGTLLAEPSWVESEHSNGLVPVWVR